MIADADYVNAEGELKFIEMKYASDAPVFAAESTRLAELIGPEISSRATNVTIIKARRSASN
jgi:hypothetical protein